MAAVKSSLVLVIASLFGLATGQIYNVEFPDNFINKAATPVVDGEAPHHALLLYQLNPTVMKIISFGLIYGKSHMVTIATNLKLNEADNYFIQAGKLTIGTTVNKTELYKVENITIHSGFDEIKNKDNIAILRVTDGFTVGINLKAAAITNRLTQGNEQCMITSWTFNNTNTAKLVKLNKNTIDRSSCTNFINGDFSDPGKVICSSVIVEYNTCSLLLRGAPLICGGKVAGFVLMNYNCTEGEPTITAHLELYHYRQWMADNSSSSITASILTILATLYSIIKSNNL